MITIRPATTADVEAVRSVARAAYAPLVERIGREPAAVTAITAVTAAGATATRAGHVRVACEDDQVVGLLVVRPEVDHLLVESVAVHPARAGRGIGSQLLLHAEALAVTFGVGEVRLVTEAALGEHLEFCTARGFAEMQRDVDGGVGRVVHSRRP